jgi:hypothetical protein
MSDYIITCPNHNSWIADDWDIEGDSSRIYEMTLSRPDLRERKGKPAVSNFREEITASSGHRSSITSDDMGFTEAESHATSF